MTAAAIPAPDPPLPPPEAEPDAGFFAMILETDLANIVKKATAGQPLTKREREMIEAERERRQAQAAAAADPAANFALDANPPSPLAGMLQRELAQVWGYSHRTIKNWIADGRAAKDPAPLTRPAEMPAWFARIYAPRECPEKLELATQRILAGFAAPSATAPKNAEPPAAAPEKVEIAEEEKGLLAMLDRYRTAEVTLHAKYMAAIDAGEETKANFLMAEWSKLGEKCRALEKAAPKALEELGIFVRRDEVQRELAPLHDSILKAFRQSFRLHRSRLRSTDTSSAWNAIVDAIVDEVALMLAATSFTAPLELSSQ